MNSLARRNANAGRAPTPIETPEAFCRRLVTPDRAEELRRMLPSHVPIDRFIRNLEVCVAQNPRITGLDNAILLREVGKAASMGLLLDPFAGEAYIVPVYDPKANGQVPQLRVGYKGLIKLVRQTGTVSAVYAHEVCEGDQIECELGLEKKLVHKPNLFGTRGKVVGYYAVVRFKDGDSDFEPMTHDQIVAIRDRTDGWRAFKEGKIKDTPWAAAFDEMAKKTVIRRLLKRLPQAIELDDAVRGALGDEDRAEGLTIDGTATAVPTRPVATIAAQTAAFARTEPVNQPADEEDEEDVSFGGAEETAAEEPPPAYTLVSADGEVTPFEKASDFAKALVALLEGITDRSVRREVHAANLDGIDAIRELTPRWGADFISKVNDLCRDPEPAQAPAEAGSATDGKAPPEEVPADEGDAAEPVNPEAEALHAALTSRWTA